MDTKPREPTWYECNPMFASHDQRCAVEEGEFAVYNCQTGVFHPSWKAQKDGWRMIQVTTWWQRLLFKLAGHHGKRFETNRGEQ
jgi:hypothetical protein